MSINWWEFPIDFPEDMEQLIFMNNFNLKSFGHKKNSESILVQWNSFDLQYIRHTKYFFVPCQIFGDFVNLEEQHIQLIAAFKTFHFVLTK